MIPSDDEPLAIGESLDSVIAALRAPANRARATPDAPGPATASAIGGLFRDWATAVGPQIAAHARPVVLDCGRLVIEVDEPGWATQLRFLESELIAKVTPVVAPDRVDRVEVRVAGANVPRRSTRGQATQQARKGRKSTPENPIS